MKEQDLTDKLGYECLLAGDGAEIESGYTSDLLSDVMGNAPGNCVLVTIQAHKNTVAVADLAGIKAIVLANNRHPDEGMLQAAGETGIGLYIAPDNQFTVSNAIGRLLGV